MKIFLSKIIFSIFLSLPACSFAVDFKIDVVGIDFQTKIDQIASKIMSDPSSQWRRRKTVRVTTIRRKDLPYWYAGFNVNEEIFGRLNNQKLEERITISYSELDKRPFVIRRNVEFPTGKEISRNVLLQKMFEKYGKPSFAATYDRREEFVWVYTRSGKLVETKAEALSLDCKSAGMRQAENLSRDYRLATVVPENDAHKCGATITVAAPPGFDGEVISGYSISLINHLKWHEERQAEYHRQLSEYNKAKSDKLNSARTTSFDL